MPYLIDGHNLIPKLGLRLDSPDDEMELVAVIQEFARLARRDVQLYFDGAPPGQPPTRRFGRVTAHFVRTGTTADDAIKRHIHRLGGAARNWTVVSSDHAIQVEARAAHTAVVSSADFARQLRRLQSSAERPAGDKALTSEEIAEWMKEFNGRP
ncbi:MAG: NYN domain-containing protein [Anaerolineae bacterium]